MRASTFFFPDEDPLTFSSSYGEWTMERSRFNMVSPIFSILFPYKCSRVIYLNNEYTSEGVDFIKGFIENGLIGLFSRNNIFDFLWFCCSWGIESEIENIMQYVKNHFSLTELIEFINKMFIKGIDTSFLVDFLMEGENQNKIKSASLLKKLPISIVEKLLITFSSTMRKNDPNLFFLPNQSKDRPVSIFIKQKKRRFTLMDNPTTNLKKRKNQMRDDLGHKQDLDRNQGQNQKAETQKTEIQNETKDDFDKYLSSSQILNLLIYFLQKKKECLTLLNFVDFSTVSRSILKRFLEALQTFTEDNVDNSNPQKDDSIKDIRKSVNPSNSLISKICKISYNTISTLEKENADLITKNSIQRDSLSKALSDYVELLNKDRNKSDLVSKKDDVFNISSGNTNENQRPAIDYLIYKEIKKLNEEYSQEFLIKSAKSYFADAVLEMAINSEKKNIKESTSYYSTFLGSKFKSNEKADNYFCQHLLDVTYDFEANQNASNVQILLSVINKMDFDTFPIKRKEILFTIFKMEERNPTFFINKKSDALDFYQGKCNSILTKSFYSQKDVSFDDANNRVINCFPILRRCLDLGYKEAYYFYTNKLMSVCNNASSSFKASNKEYDFMNCFNYVYSKIDQDDPVFEFYYATLKFFGNGFCNKDEVTSMTVLKKSAQSNHPMAMLFYGVLLNFGTNAKPANIEESKTFLSSFILYQSFNLRKDEFEKKVALYIFNNIDFLTFDKNTYQLSEDEKESEEINYYYEIKAILMLNFKDTFDQNDSIVYRSSQQNNGTIRKKISPKTCSSREISQHMSLNKKDFDYRNIIKRNDSSDMESTYFNPNKSIKKQQYMNSLDIVELFIENDIEIIKTEAFLNCKNLKFVYIPSSVKRIGKLAFANCTSLEFFVIESSKTKIDPSAFLYCDNVQIRYFVDDHQQSNSGKKTETSEKVMAYSKPISIHEYIQKIALQGEYIVPFGSTMLSFDDYDFRPMKTMIIPWSVKCVERGAFKDNNTIENIVILGNCHIKKKAFKHCQKLKSVMFISSGRSEITDENRIHMVEKFRIRENFEDKRSNNNLHHPLHNRSKSISLDNVYKHSKRSKSRKNSADIENNNSRNVSLLAEIDRKEYITGTKSIFSKNKINHLNNNYNESDEFNNNNNSNFNNLPNSFDDDDNQNCSIIGRQSFEDCPNLESLFIPNKIDKIEDFAFINCRKLKKVEINKEMLINDYQRGKECFCASSIFFCCPADLTINNDNFSRHILSEYNSQKFTIDFNTNISAVNVGQFKNDNELENVLIMWNVSHIYEFAFNHCTNLKSVIIFTDNLIIHDKAFINCCNLSEVSIVVRGKCEIGIQAFENCQKLKEFNLVAQFSVFSSKVFNGCSELKTFNIPNGLKKLPKEIFFNCSKLKHVHLPKSMEIIDDRCFKNCSSLETIHIPNNVHFYGKECFMFCISLKTITISNSLEKLGNKCFFGCEKLNNVCLLSSYSSNQINDNDCTSENNYNVNFKLERISESCFEACKHLKEISLPSSIKYLGDRCFMNCKRLEKVDLSYTKIAVLPVYSFSNCSKLKTVILPIGEHLKKILMKSFEECVSIEEMSFPLSLTEIGEKVFENCKNLRLLDLEKNQNIVSIEAETFSGCLSLNNFVFPENVKTIRTKAFSNCEKLENIELPNKVEGVLDFAFSDCINLKSVVIQSEIMRFNENVFENCPNFKKIIILNRKCNFAFEKEDWVKNGQIQIIHEVEKTT